MKKQYIIPIFVPHLGCPNDCVFCNQKSISGQTKDVTKEDVRKTIDEHLKYIKEDSIVEVAFFGGSFTGIEEEKQIELLSAVSEYIKNKKVQSIRISTRPDYINKRILKILKKYNVKTIELGVQSTSDYILKMAGRGHTFEDVKKASKLIRFYGFNLGHQMMVGLPESTHLDEINTAKQLIKLKPKMVRIYPVLVIKGTKLEKDYNEGNYKPLTITQAVELCKEIVKLFAKKKIEVIRIGLQPTDTIASPELEKSEVVAGPFHPAFRQLVEAGIWYDVIVEKIKKLNAKVKEVVVTVNPQDVNNVIGQRIKQARLAKNMTQEDLAEQIDISVAFLSRVERGNSHINLKRLNQLCGLLDTTEGYILNGASSNSENYLDQEFAELLKGCSPEKQRLIYNIAKTIAETN